MAHPLSGRPSSLWSKCKPTHSELYGTKLALIIDDDEIGHIVIGQCLEPLGYKVAAAFHARQCSSWMDRSVDEDPRRVYCCAG